MSSSVRMPLSNSIRRRIVLHKTFRMPLSNSVRRHSVLHKTYYNSKVGFLSAVQRQKIWKTNSVRRHKI
jgi:hypothetical protein